MLLQELRYKDYWKNPSKEWKFATWNSFYKKERPGLFPAKKNSSLEIIEVIDAKREREVAAQTEQARYFAELTEQQNLMNAHSST
ncbi:5211_t:CDS:2 [Dentiscutata erythropus]|uniref:5211_t:CDS:1 n=1 Tax=Dentiscutata erythropus TaxID=1348616 RepID=A0A9N9DTS9_9GLOM|nr:5211_t:CDS:2 [Dentiscutata erythropus]